MRNNLLPGDHADSAASESASATTLHSLSRYAKALPRHREALCTQQAQLLADSLRSQHQRSLADAEHELAMTLQATLGQHAASLPQHGPRKVQSRQHMNAADAAAAL